jgi:uncharacterized membrane protein YagU involved in acid resistance
MLCRAVPLSVGLLLGRRYNRPILGLSIAMVVQTFIFGAGHANYPMMPAYARVVELIVPSLIFGFIYLRMGVLFGAITHYLYDVVLFSLPIFVSSGYIFDKSMVLFVAFIPLGVVLVQRYRAKGWNELKDEAFNRSFVPEVKTEPETEIISESETEIGIEKDYQNYPQCGNKKIWAIGLLLSLIGLWVFQDNRIDIPMDSIELNREKAIAVAEQYLEDNNLQLAEGYQGYATYKTHNHSDAFVWQELGEGSYNDLLNSYLLPPGWSIRFVNYAGDLESKSEEINLRMDLQGRVNYFDHIIPEERSGVSLSKEVARVIADEAIKKRFGLDVASLEVVSEISKQQPKRMDWTFVYEEPNDYEYEGMQLRSQIKIAGDQVIYAHQYVFIPETWQRMNRERWVMPNTLNKIANFVGGLLIIFIFLKHGFKLLATKGFSYTTSTVFALLGSLIFVNFLNDASLFANLPTDQPIMNLKLIQVISFGVMGVISCFFFGLAFAVLRSILKENNHKISVFSAVLGGLFAAAVFYLMTLPLEMCFPNTRVTYPSIFSVNYYFPFIGTLNIYPDLLWKLAIDLLTAKLLFSFTKGYQNSVKCNLIGFALITILVGFAHFPVEFLVGISLLKIALISLGTFLIFKYIIRNNYLMVPIFTLGIHYFNNGLARGGFFGVESYPYQSIITLASVLIAGMVFLFCMRFVIESNKQ